MLAKCVFGIFCALFMHPILRPGQRGDVAASGLTCPSGSTADNVRDYVRDTRTPLVKRVFKQAMDDDTLKPRTATEAANVYIRMDAESLYCYEREEEIILEAFVTLWWTDKLICWDPADYNNINNITLGFLDLFIWVPQLISYTKSIETFDLEFEKSDCIVFYNGTVQCRYVLFITGMCNMHLRDWPIASEADCWIWMEIFNPAGRQKLLHRDNRSSSEWLSAANVGNPGQFVATEVSRQTEGNGVVYRFRFEATTSGFGNAIIDIAGVLSVILALSFWLPAGSVARVSLLGCVCLSLILTIGFLGSQLSSVTPDTPHIVRLHGDILIIAAVALLPATLLAPRLAPTKPYIWQLSLRSWLLSSATGRILLKIYRVSSPSDREVTTLGEEAQHGSSFQKEDNETSTIEENSTRTLLFTLFDRIVGGFCCVAVFSLWIAMYCTT